MLSDRSLLLAFGGGFNLIDKQLCDIGANLPTSPSPAEAAAAACIYLEKVKHEKLSPHVTKASEAQFDSLNEASMESAASINNSNCTNRNSNNTKNSNSNIANSLIISQVKNALSGSSSNLTIANMTNNHPHQQHSLHHSSQQPQSAQKNNVSNIGNVKREGLSPGAGPNGDLQSVMSRSRSTTPSSFRGASPQHMSTETLMPLTSILRIQQAASAGRHNSSIIAATMDTAHLVTTNAALPTEFSTHNYSDIMRNLAAKYNDSNPKNSSSARRNTFFENSSTTPTASVLSKNINQQTGIRNAGAAASQSVLPKKDAQPQLMPRLSMSPGEVAVAAAAASFLSNLPFSQSVCPPLIDMSSTQALVTLARAAKEAEIQTILRSTQQNPKPINSTPASPHPNLSVALQQAAQFVSPALIYSTQLQKQQQIQSSRQSSPLHSSSVQKSKSSVATSAATVPLDLSSQPPAAKRFKVELHAAGSSSESVGPVSSNAAMSPSSPTSENNVLIGSSGGVQRARSNTPDKFSDSVSPAPAITRQSPTTQQCQAQSEEVARWTVDNVCAFVGEIDICADYVQHFRDQCIDGSGLPLLTEDHLLNSLGMKLGPALKLRSILAKKLGGPCPCVTCITQARQMLALQAAAKNDAVRPISTMPIEAPAAAGDTSTVGATNDIATISDINEKEKQTREERQEVQQTQTQITEQRRPSVSINNESSSSCSALTLQISANIYKNAPNSDSHNNEKVSGENKRSGVKVANKTTGGNTCCILDTPFDSIANKDCKSNSRSGGSSNTKNGSLQRAGTGDVADVGS
ncbi:probable serine/threonine-protein kinase nek3 [Anastrepha ludens]|uniref:probable serine/threonine-protein kinase nek3 n=1 Tax=Anastrepha ludens TaxID=28586 RepID=UPI0023AFC96A|nr:probable serine/threonine-protein kinase nek3 [Anastrepha ludens]XP_053961142.1 probable serine/threonine-protein kinase nek3 [Anastrepha ludens]XP_053961143.1 probable serine/threonine-protein kinase nek3 [Anastrepha ludens]